MSAAAAVCSLKVRPWTSAVCAVFAFSLKAQYSLTLLSHAPACCPQP
jgi:hypothetical protein